MKDIPDIHKNDARDFEHWLAGYPFDNRSRRLEQEREREAELKGEEDRKELELCLK
jgi:hypothetical protein